MNKNAIIANMFARYNRLSGTHNYIMPVLEDGIVYAVFTTADVVSKVLSLDVSSRGNGYSIRYKRATKNTQAILKAGATAIVPLCSVEYLESVAETLGKRALYWKMESHTTGRKKKSKGCSWCSWEIK